MLEPPLRTTYVRIPYHTIPIRRFTIWPDEALASVARQSLAELGFEALLLEAVSGQCVAFHKTARHLTNK